ncbi:hypothetical protein UlMin_008484 [Ulmus minor]
MVMTIIRGHKLDAYLLGFLPCPPELILAEPTTQGEAGVGLKLNPKYEQWVVNDQLLMGWLYGSMNESIATQVMGCSTSINLWKALENLYRAHLNKGSTSMDDYLKQMKSWADILAIAGNPYPESQLITNVMSGLDGEYMPIVVLIESRDMIYWQELQDTLLSYDSKLEHINRTNKMVAAPTANFATSKGTITTSAKTSLKITALVKLEVVVQTLGDPREEGFVVVEAEITTAQDQLA